MIKKLLISSVERSLKTTFSEGINDAVHRNIFFYFNASFPL
jgi:hypothetical protein